MRRKVNAARAEDARASVGIHRTYTINFGNRAIVNPHASVHARVREKENAIDLTRAWTLA